ncbi:MAG TPA: response regulator transcription factor [Methylomirabilota bacterium]|nr:response regulator transcription factor [Methylomirabilota bacterium]
MSARSKIKILVVDDHFVVRVGLIASLHLEGDFSVAGEAGTVRQAVDIYQQCRPNLVLSDMRLPDGDGGKLAAELGHIDPESRVLILSTYQGDDEILRALQAGAKGYIPKTIGRDGLLQAIRTVAAGGSYLTPEIASRIAMQVTRPNLTQRELEVLRLIVAGQSNKEIASSLAISEVTVKLHVGHVLEKLGVHDRTNAVTMALRRGIVSLDSAV